MSHVQTPTKDEGRDGGRGGAGGDTGGRDEQGHPRSYRFAWRRQLARNPVTNQAYRVGVAVVGAVVVLAGLAMVPLVGPGWLVVFVGIGLWASEFEWASRLLGWGKHQLQRWNHWMGQQSWWVKGLFGLFTFACVVGALWLVMAVSGVPGLLPDGLENRLRDLPGLG